jgi:hypothetical protein
LLEQLKKLSFVQQLVQKCGMVVTCLDICIYTIYIYMVREYIEKNMCTSYRNTMFLSELPVLQCLQPNYIFTDNVRLSILSCNVKMSKQLPPFTAKIRYKRHFTRFHFRGIPCHVRATLLPILTFRFTLIKFYEVFICILDE